MVTKKCVVYLAQSMTGYSKSEQVQLALKAKVIFETLGLEIISPVLEEGIKDEPGVVTNTGVDLDWKWRKLDKPALKHKAFVLCVLNADNKSFGCEREYMLMRGCYWQPVVIVSPKHANGYVSIANYEDDYIAGTVEEAAAYIGNNWRTWWQRFVWKLWVLSKLPKWLGLQLKRLI